MRERERWRMWWRKRGEGIRERRRARERGEGQLPKRELGFGILTVPYGGKETAQYGQNNQETKKPNNLHTHTHIHTVHREVKLIK